MQKHIPEDMITHIEDSGELIRMVRAWNMLDPEFLERYFKRDGKPYISFSNNLISTAKRFLPAKMLTGDVINSSNQTMSVVPLPLLCVRQHFVWDNRTIDMTSMEAYNRMLDMCLEHGLSIDACDSTGITLLNASIAYFSIFRQLLPEESAEGSWQNSKVSYSSDLFDYSVAGILLNRGANPFCRTENKYCMNVLNNAVEGVYCASDCLKYCYPKNPGMWNTGISSNMFYTDVFSHICRNAPDFVSSPLQIHEQQNIVNKVIEGGFIQFTSNMQNNSADKFVSILENLLSKNIVSDKGLYVSHNKKRSRSQQVSSLYCLSICRR